MDINEIRTKVIEVEKGAVQEITEQPLLMPNYDKEAPSRDTVVDNVYNQAIGHVVQNDKEVQQSLLEAAKDSIANKVDAIKNDVEKENKRAFFENNEDACQCFGFNEATTPKWAVAIMRWIYNVIMVIYILIASVSIMPIAFLCKKMSVVIKNIWIAIILSVLIWAGITFVPILLTLLT